MKNRLETEDIYALYIGLHYPFALKRYLDCKQKPLVHKVSVANIILGRTYGTLLYLEDIIELCNQAGMQRRDAKLFRSYEFLDDKEQDRLKKAFIDGYVKLGYCKKDACNLFYYVAYTARDCLRRKLVAKHVEIYLKTANMQLKSDKLV